VTACARCGRESPDGAADGRALARAERLLGLVDESLDEIEMALLVERSRHIVAGARAALGDTDAAPAILSRLADSAERRGYVRFAELYRRDLDALATSGRD